MSISNTQLKDSTHQQLHSSLSSPKTPEGTLKDKKVAAIGPRNTNIAITTCCYLFVLTIACLIMNGTIGGCLWGMAGSNASMLLVGKLFVGFAAVNLLVLVFFSCCSSCWLRYSGEALSHSY